MKPVLSSITALCAVSSIQNSKDSRDSRGKFCCNQAGPADLVVLGLGEGRSYFCPTPTGTLLFYLARAQLAVDSAAKCGEFSPKWGFLTVPKGGFLTVLFSKISENVGIFKNFGPSGDFHPKTFGSTGS